ncbi:hypothetical protein SPAN111604_10355 [Sphingomonas antarctica]|uniref:PEPxxWA-CTERM sorting domain-containing protein n=1 Tax=Sphingomonas antarctica TaxID=2040274 RepID=UPI0039E81E08
MNRFGIASALALAGMSAAAGAAITTISGTLDMARPSINIPFDGSSIGARYAVTAQFSRAFEGSFYYQLEDRYNIIDPDTGQELEGNEGGIGGYHEFNRASYSFAFNVAPNRSRPYYDPRFSKVVLYGTYQLFQYADLTVRSASFAPISYLITTDVSAFVPEPAAWTMLLAGFGFVGGLSRRRSNTTSAASAAI